MSQFPDTYYHAVLVSRHENNQYKFWIPAFNYRLDDVNTDDVQQTAEALLANCIISIEKESDQVPPPPRPSLQDMMDLAQNDLGTIWTPMLVEVYLPVYRAHIATRAVKKTLTIPKWLNVRRRSMTYAFLKYCRRH